MSSFLRLMSRLKQYVLPNARVPDLASLEWLNCTDPAQNLLCRILLRAIADNESRLRFHPHGHIMLVFGTSVGPEQELVPLLIDQGRAVLAVIEKMACKANRNARLGSLCCIPVLVGGNPVTLYVQSDSNIHGEGMSIAIHDPLRPAVLNAEGARNRRQERFVEGCGGQQYVHELKDMLQK